MRWMVGAACVVGLVLAVLAGWALGGAGRTPTLFSAEPAWGEGDHAAQHAPWEGVRAMAPPRQVPDLLRSIVEAVQRALQELEDSLREEVCGHCPAAASTLVLASVLAAGCGRARRR
ncbi:MAG: hypothetical protein JXA09_10975 [Anaerolineae bacterium]|nr:hypothetical protein [Anaerolineae bacterium]